MRIHPIVASRFRSDGGAMFGLVPKPIWSRLIAPNERNGIPQNANTLLLELDDGRKGLVDTGCGNPGSFSEKERNLSGLETTDFLAEGLAARGVSAEELDFVIFSHLHWDHAGGAGDPADPARVTFPRAEHFVHAEEWEDATSGNPLLYKSYPSSAIEPLKKIEKEGRLTLVDGADEEILPGVRLARTGGHTRGHCAVILKGPDFSLQHPDAGRDADWPYAVFAADACPTSAHLRMVFQTAYDTYPLDTRAWKREWLARIAADGALLLFCHDPALCGATLAPDERKEFVTAEPYRIVLDA